jgi:hypothetical protein
MKVRLKRKCHKFLTFCFLLFFAAHAFAQENLRVEERKGSRYLRESLEAKQGQAYAINPGFSFTSVTVRCKSCTSFQGAYIIASGDTSWLKQDAHAPEETGLQSNLLIFSEAISSLEFITQRMEGKVEFIYLNASGKAGESQENRRLEQNSGTLCDKPDAIDQSVWRQGLPEPSYTRSFTNVEHLIVHHSATSNSATDYTSVVRNIYLYHTDVNGWSDIGYNYLVAPDGTIYKGRDPGTGEQDNVRGAHFCGKNSGTMGICLLGEYDSAQPAEAMLQSLLHLLTWKSDKENLDPLSSSPHPANTNLRVVAGHRDGCSTICPGDNVYATLPQLRQETAAAIENCEDNNDDVLVVHPNPTTGLLVLNSSDIEEMELHLYDMTGKREDLHFRGFDNENSYFSLHHLAQGIYILQVQKAGKVTKKKILIL